MRPRSLVRAFTSTAVAAVTRTNARAIAVARSLLSYSSLEPSPRQRRTRRIGPTLRWFVDVSGSAQGANFNIWRRAVARCENAGMRWSARLSVPLSVLVGLCAVALLGCADEPDTCQRLTSAMADRREACGAPRGNDEWTIGGCDYQYIMEERCRLGCWERASCEAIRGEDTAGATTLHRCIDGCGP
jgi:hypothetical protein